MTYELTCAERGILGQHFGVSAPAPAPAPQLVSGIYFISAPILAPGELDFISTLIGNLPTERTDSAEH